jgi:hypothetical protein
MIAPGANDPHFEMLMPPNSWPQPALKRDRS